MELRRVVLHLHKYKYIMRKNPNLIQYKYIIQYCTVVIGCTSSVYIQYIVYGTLQKLKYKYIVYPFPGYSSFFGELAHNMLIYCQEII